MDRKRYYRGPPGGTAMRGMPLIAMLLSSGNDQLTRVLVTASANWSSFSWRLDSVISLL